MHTPSTVQRLAAEFLGTFWLVFAGCGSAIFAATYVTGGALTGGSLQLGIGFLGVALAFGLSVTTMSYAVGHVSGAHFNPAVTVGLSVARRFEWRDVPGYVAAQVVGGLVAGTTLWAIARGRDGFDATGHMAANGYGEHSPGGYQLFAVLVAEAILTAMFVYLILGVTDSRSPRGFEPLAIGLGFALVYLVSIPISNGAANPARSTAVAFFNGNGAPGQLWLFWAAPLLGGAIAGATFHLITGIDRRDRDISGAIASADVMVARGIDPDAPRG